MMSICRKLRLAILAMVGLLEGSAGAEAQLFESGGFRMDGDLRARLEADFDSRTSGGAARDDRARLRVRLRLGLGYRAGERLAFGVRLRSGSNGSQQSPHVTVVDFDGNDAGDADFNFDKWFLKLRGEKLWASAGRDQLPFWTQNELLWDGDVIPAGLAAGYRAGDDERSVEFRGGYFSLPAGMRRFSGTLGCAQGVFHAESFTAAVGLLAIDADPEDPDAALLLQDNGSRDYRLWVASLQYRTGAWTFGADLLHNAESYPESEPQRGEVDGYIGSIRFDHPGGGRGGGWHAAWSYAHIEALAVHSSYAQDDWVRWGSATQTRASDLRGHELSFVNKVGHGQDVAVRLYLVEALSSIEDGKRLRIDYNYTF